MRARLALAALCVALGLALLVQQSQIRALESRLAALETDTIELAPLMHSLQVHAHKLWFAGRAANWDLAGFYLHEMGETLEVIEAAGLQENGVDLAETLHTGLLPAVATLERVARARDGNAFVDAYRAAVSSCNECHTATGHGFVIIQNPSQPVLDNQRYGGGSRWSPALRGH